MAARHAPLSVDSPGKSTGVGCHFLLQGIFPTRGSNPCLLCLLYWQAGSLPLSYRGSPLPNILFINGCIVDRSEDTATLRTHCQNRWKCDDIFFSSLFNLTQGGIEFCVLSLFISKSQNYSFLCHTLEFLLFLNFPRLFYGMTTLGHFKFRSIYSVFKSLRSIHRKEVVLFQGH